jgi:protein-disulfide isomerase
MMARIRLLALATFAAMAIGAPLSASAQIQRADVEEIVRQYLASHPEELGPIVRQYLIEHPEAVRDALAVLLAQRLSNAPAGAAAPTVDKTALIRQNAAALFNSAHQVTLGNPNGDVTLVEFFDYNCRFCRRALNDTLALLKSDAGLRIVLKDFPILGPGSVEAARVGIAVRMQDPSGAKSLEFHQRMLSAAGPASQASALAVAGELGLDRERLEKDIESDEARQTLDEGVALARSLGLNATPSYVVGDNVVYGAVGFAALRDKVQATRR